MIVKNDNSSAIENPFEELDISDEEDELEILNSLISNGAEFEQVY